jgi:hypothetical protein
MKLTKEQTLIVLDTKRENAIGNYRHYCSIGDTELASMYMEMILDIEDDIVYTYYD